MGAAAARAGVRAVPKPPPSVTSSRSGRGEEVNTESSGVSSADNHTTDDLESKRSPVADLQNRSSSFRPEQLRTSPEIHQRSDSLVERLKSVYVDSVDEVVERPPYPLKIEKKARRLDPHMGGSVVQGLSQRDVPITMNVPEGFVTYQQVMLALILHQQDPQTWTVEKVSGQLKLSVDDVRNLFKYYSVFSELHHRDMEDYAGLAVGLNELESHSRKQS